MKVLVSYDSRFGNTERLARAMAQTLAIAHEVTVRRVDEGPLDLSGYDLAVIGGPTHGHTASAPLKTALERLPHRALPGLRVALFDTRFRLARLLTGSAAATGARLLKTRGIALAAPGESFFVTKGGEPALEDGELERAAAWAESLVANRLWI